MMPSPKDATTAAEGRKYARRLIRDTLAKHFGDAGPTELEEDLLTFVAEDLLGPYWDATRAERRSSSCGLVIRGMTIVFRKDALQAFATAIWTFVSEHKDKVREATLEAFLGDS